MKARLKQTQDSYQNLLSDQSQQAGGQKEAEAHIGQLQNALEDAEADRDAADEQSARLARRTRPRRRAAAQAEAAKP